MFLPKGSERVVELEDDGRELFVGVPHDVENPPLRERSERERK
jgi:hypothetical protein